jgi:hypothetical protein
MEVSGNNSIFITETAILHHLPSAILLESKAVKNKTKKGLYL